MDIVWLVYMNGGWIMHLLLALWLVGLVVCVAQITALRRVNFIPVITGVAVLILLLGCYSYAEVQVISGESVDALRRDGSRLELESIMSKPVGTNMAGLLFSLGFGMVLTLLGGITATLRVNQRRPSVRSEEG